MSTIQPSLTVGAAAAVVLIVQGGHLHWKVSDFKSGRGKVFLHVVNYCKYCAWHKIFKIGVLYLVKFCMQKVAVIVMRIYEYCSEKKHAFHFAWLQGSILHKYSLEMSGKVGEKSGNLIMTGEWSLYMWPHSDPEPNCTTTSRVRPPDCSFLRRLPAAGGGILFTSSVSI